MKRTEMTAYIAGENSTGVAVIICPGGSYCYLGMNGEGHRVAKWLQENGISAFVLRYRVGMYGNRYPAMIQDLQRAIQIVREDYADRGVVPEKVGVMGFSAGGHLAGTAATYFETDYLESAGIQTRVSLRPAFVAMIYPVVSMTDSIVHKKSRRNLLGRHYTEDLRHRMSLEQNVRQDMPPVFLIHCRRDRTVDCRNAICYQQALTAKQVPCAFTLYDEKGHGFGINCKHIEKHATAWTEIFIPWLQEILADTFVQAK
ncbi:MAG: alpha/beta hydrolase [Tannerella sp.]|nr:alpha/beta hydrolase [Tannerella sp.]